MKILVSIVLGVTVLSVSPLFVISEVEAQAQSQRAGAIGNTSGNTSRYVACPTGTCSRNGTQVATDLKYCTAANCAKAKK